MEKNNSPKNILINNLPNIKKKLKNSDENSSKQIANSQKPKKINLSKILTSNDFEEVLNICYKAILRNL